MTPTNLPQELSRGLFDAAGREEGVRQGVCECSCVVVVVVVVAVVVWW